MAMRNKNLFTAILVVALAAAACGSSEPETVTSAAPADESPPATAQQPVEGDPADGSPDEGHVSDSGESGSLGDEDSGTSSSSSSDDADSDYGDEDSGVSDEDLGVSTSSSSDDAGASSGSLDDAVSVTQDEIVGDGADISDPGPSNSGEPVPPLDQRKLAHVTDVAFQVLESWPMQVIVEVSGELPDPCHHVWWEVDVDGNTYDVQVWQVSPPPGAEIACAQVMEPFTENVPLGGGFVSEDYTVIVNGKSHPLSL